MGTPPEDVPYAFVAPPEKNLSVSSISLPSCAWLMTRLLIDNPYTWNGRRRAHRGLQKINTIEKNQQDRTTSLRRFRSGKGGDHIELIGVRSGRGRTPGGVDLPQPHRFRVIPMTKKRRRPYRAHRRPQRTGRTRKRRWPSPANRLRATLIEKRRRPYRAQRRPQRTRSNSQEALAFLSQPAPSDPDEEKTAAISSSTPPAADPVKHQGVLTFPSKPVSSDPDEEKTATISSSSAPAADLVEPQGALTFPSKPASSDPDEEKTAAIPSSITSTPRPQELTASSSPPIASDPDIKKSAVVPNSPSLAQNHVGREETMVPPSFPRSAQKQVDRNQPVTEVRPTGIRSAPTRHRRHCSST